MFWKKEKKKQYSQAYILRYFAIDFISPLFWVEEVNSLSNVKANELTSVFGYRHEPE